MKQKGGKTYLATKLTFEPIMTQKAIFPSLIKWVSLQLKNKKQQVMLGIRVDKRSRSQAFLNEYHLREYQLLRCHHYNR